MMFNQLDPIVLESVEDQPACFKLDFLDGDILDVFRWEADVVVFYNQFVIECRKSWSRISPGPATRIFFGAIFLNFR